jgi:hypothetical protein
LKDIKSSCVQDSRKYCFYNEHEVCLQQGQALSSGEGILMFKFLAIFLAVFFFKPIPASPPDGLGRGMAQDKILAPSYSKASRTGVVAPPEPWPNPRLPTKEESEEKKTDHQKRS